MYSKESVALLLKRYEPVETNTRFQEYVDSLCYPDKSSTSGNKTVCEVPNIEEMFEGTSTSDTSFELKIAVDYTRMYSEAFFNDYKDACSNAGEKICYVTIDRNVSDPGFDVILDINGSPSCYAQICNETGIKMDENTLGDFAFSFVKHL